MNLSNDIIEKLTCGIKLGNTVWLAKSETIKERCNCAEV